MPSTRHDGYILSPAAEVDLESIWRYSAENWGRQHADGYIHDIRSAIEQLALGHRKGRAIDYVRPNYRKLGVGSHFIIYRPADDVIDIIRILHQRMDIPTRLQN